MHYSTTLHCMGVWGGGVFISGAGGGEVLKRQHFQRAIEKHNIFSLLLQHPCFEKSYVPLGIQNLNDLVSLNWGLTMGALFEELALAAHAWWKHCNFLTCEGTTELWPLII